MPYPPPPWRLAGPCVVVTGLIPVDLVRDRVPHDLAIVQVRGLTVASIMLADYQQRATLPYGELAVMPALVRCRGVRGPWISDIWVDSPASRDGGREMWGLAKELADFTWQFGATSTATVTAGEQTLGSWSWRTPRRRVPYPGWFRGIGSVAGDRRRYRGRGSARLGRTDVTFDVPEGSVLGGVYRSLQRPVWMAGEVNLTFDDIRILTPPGTASPAAGHPDGRST